MNKDNAKDYLPLVQALAEGKEVQTMGGDGAWHDQIAQMGFDFSLPPEFYRIKPEPRGPRVWYFAEDKNGLSTVPWETAEQALEGEEPGTRAIRFVEDMGDEA